MRARLVVFPIRGRKWCFSRSIDHSGLDSESSQIPSTLKDLWKKIASSPPPDNKSTAANAQLLVDFAANKMNRAWTALEKAPAGSFKSKIHGLGLRLLSRVKPSEIFLKSIANEITNVEVVYPSSLSARLVRRRLRHIAFRGTALHKNYFYGSVALLPLTTAFTVLPLPNIPFFWILFRTYSNWRALKGSEKLLELVSDCSENQQLSTEEAHGKRTVEDNSKRKIHNPLGPPLVLQPSKELERRLQHGAADGGLNDRAIAEICKAFDLNTMDVLKYQQTTF